MVVRARVATDVGDRLCSAGHNGGAVRRGNCFGLNTGGRARQLQGSVAKTQKELFNAGGKGIQAATSHPRVDRLQIDGVDFTDGGAVVCSGLEFGAFAKSAGEKGGSCGRGAGFDAGFSGEESGG